MGDSCDLTSIPPETRELIFYKLPTLDGEGQPPVGLDLVLTPEDGDKALKYYPAYFSEDSRVLQTCSADGLFRAAARFFEDRNLVEGRTGDGVSLKKVPFLRARFEALRRTANPPHFDFLRTLRAWYQAAPEEVLRDREAREFLLFIGSRFLPWSLEKEVLWFGRERGAEALRQAQFDWENGTVRLGENDLWAFASRLGVSPGFLQNLMHEVGILYPQERHPEERRFQGNHRALERVFLESLLSPPVLKLSDEENVRIIVQALYELGDYAVAAEVWRRTGHAEDPWLPFLEDAARRASQGQAPLRSYRLYLEEGTQEMPFSDVIGERIYDPFLLAVGCVGETEITPFVGVLTELQEGTFGVEDVQRVGNVTSRSKLQILLFALQYRRYQVSGPVHLPPELRIFTDPKIPPAAIPHVLRTQAKLVQEVPRAIQTVEEELGFGHPEVMRDYTVLIGFPFGDEEGAAAASRVAHIITSLEGFCTPNGSLQWPRLYHELTHLEMRRLGSKERENDHLFEILMEGSAHWVAQRILRRKMNDPDSEIGDRFQPLEYRDGLAFWEAIEREHGASTVLGILRDIETGEIEKLTEAELNTVFQTRTGRPMEAWLREATQSLSLRGAYLSAAVTGRGGEFGSQVAFLDTGPIRHFVGTHIGFGRNPEGTEEDSGGFSVSLNLTYRASLPPLYPWLRRESTARLRLAEISTATGVRTGSHTPTFPLFEAGIDLLNFSPLPEGGLRMALGSALVVADQGMEPKWLRLLVGVEF